MPRGQTLHGLVDAAVDALGIRLVGAYLHGSAALGGWVPGASDLDVIFVAEPDPPEKALEAIAAATIDVTPAALATGVELSVISRDLALSPRAPWPFLLHVATSTTPGVESRVLRDNGSGDPDLLMHVAVARAAGLALYGPAPVTMFGAIQRTDVLTYLVGELRWASSQAPEKYAVLNACRALAYLETDAIVSKTDGGEWALSALPAHADLIARALRDFSRRQEVCRPQHRTIADGGLIGTASGIRLVIGVFVRPSWRVAGRSKKPRRLAAPLSHVNARVHRETGRTPVARSAAATTPPG
jgi:predicted nucleotidyltransferase